MHENRGQGGVELDFKFRISKSNLAQNFSSFISSAFLSANKTNSNHNDSIFFFIPCDCQTFFSTIKSTSKEVLLYFSFPILILPRVWFARKMFFNHACDQERAKRIKEKKTWRNWRKITNLWFRLNLWVNLIFKFFFLNFIKQIAIKSFDEKNL